MRDHVRCRPENRHSSDPHRRSDKGQNLTSTARCQTHDAKVMEARRRSRPMRFLIATSSMPRPLAHDANKPASIEGDNKHEETGCYRGLDVLHALSTPNCEQPQRTNSRAKSRPDRCEPPLRGPWQTPGPARRHQGSQGQHNQTGGEQVHSTGSLAHNSRHLEGAGEPIACIDCLNLKAIEKTVIRPTDQRPLSAYRKLLPTGRRPRDAFGSGQAWAEAALMVCKPNSRGSAG